MIYAFWFDSEDYCNSSRVKGIILGVINKHIIKHVTVCLFVLIYL